MASKTRKAPVRRTPRAVAYSGTATQARNLVKSAAAAYKEWAGQEASKTELAAKAYQAAVTSGYLYTGAAADRPGSGTVTKAELARMFEVSGAIVTQWAGLAVALDLGIATDSDEWQMLCSGKAVRSAPIKVALTGKGATVAKVSRALKANGWSVKEGKVLHATGQGQGPRTKGKDKDAPDKDAPATDTPIAPYAAALAALEVLKDALASPTIQAAEYDVIRGRMVRLQQSEDRRRGFVGRAKTARKTAKVAVPSPKDLAPTG